MPLARAEYFFKTKYIGRDFLEHWTWETMDDPTHGRVNYVDQATALQLNLSYGELNSYIHWLPTSHSLRLHSVGIQVRHARRLPKRRAGICTRTEQRAHPIG